MSQLAETLVQPEVRSKARLETLKDTTLPTKKIGPLKILMGVKEEEVFVPLATYETPLWPSTQRGTKATRLSGGISLTLHQECMSRSILLEAPSASKAHAFISSLKINDLEEITKTSSRFARFKSFHNQIVGNLIYLRFEFETGDASGHNMVTKASNHLIDWILKTYPDISYGSISGNYCTDKKVSAVNGILGRGKYVIAEATLPKDICESVLKTTPEKIHNLNVKKNLVGSIVSGGLRSANAHFANILLAFYLATGQDAANIIEGSQGIVHTDLTPEGLYFSVTLPNLIVGTTGNGKDLSFVKENLALMNCLPNPKAPGESARRLAGIIAATVLCGEISLMAAQTNPHELMQAHTFFERT